MTQATRATALNILTNVPPVEWCDMCTEYIESGQAEVLREMERELDGIIQQASRLRGYVGRRQCGTHLEAVNESNRIVRLIRKALGYTLPDGAKLQF